MFYLQVSVSGLELRAPRRKQIWRLNYNKYSDQRAYCRERFFDSEKYIRFLWSMIMSVVVEVPSR